MRLYAIVKRWNRMLLICVLAAAFLLLAGCGKSSGGSSFEGGGSSSAGSGTSSGESSTTVPEPVQPPQSADDGLNLLREMAGDLKTASRRRQYIPNGWYYILFSDSLCRQIPPLR